MICKFCQKKIFKSQGHALSGALSASRKTGKPMRAYKEPKCGHCHITKKPASWSKK